MMVLWLLILRGTAVEFRNHIVSPIWIPFWDFLFSAASLLLAVFLGAALGNVVRGVPLDDSGYFFEPLWTNFRIGDHPGILDWYTILVGVTALLALMMHGSLRFSSKQMPPSASAPRMWPRGRGGACSSSAASHHDHFYGPATSYRQFQNLAHRFCSSRNRHRRSFRHSIRIAPRQGTERLPGLLHLPPRHAYQRGLRRVSICGPPATLLIR